MVIAGARVVAVVLCLVLGAPKNHLTTAQWVAGDECTLKSGEPGTCQPLSKCPVAAHLGRINVRPVVCVYGKNPLVCCGEGLINEWYRASSTSQKPSLDTSDGVREYVRSTTRSPNQSWGLQETRAGDTITRLEQIQSDNKPITNQGLGKSAEDADMRKRPSADDLWRLPGRPQINEPKRPNHGLVTMLQNHGGTSSHNKFTWEPAGGRPTKRKSELMCDKYSQQVRDSIAAVHLLLNPDPITVDVERCSYNHLPLIVGGEMAKVGEFPHMVALGYSEKGKLSWNCGGTLISEYYVLTAAHCTYSTLGSPVVARLGELNLKVTDEAQHVDYHIAKITAHPDYVSTAKYNDIALLRLSRKVELNKFIRPACLYTKKSFAVNKTLATGWGRIDFAEDPSDTLLKVALSIIDNRKCNQLYQSDVKTSALSKGIVESMMCAGELAGGRDTCQGDSGGPIEISSHSNQCIHYVVGVTSFGKYCAGKNSPGVYTRVSYYVPWIESIVWPS